ncbi:MAG TPA: hypothetical protein GXX19_04855 [Syntrophomonadaceae bacterium]|nr:hypothetical protein [Syntrophomonadaceae bacterium]
MKVILKKLSILSFTVVLLLTYAIPASAQANSKVLDSRTVLDQLDEQMNRAGVSLFKDSRTRVEKISPNSTTINIGTNKTFTWADAGNSNYWGSGYGTYGEGFGFANEPGWADAGTYLGFIQGNAGSWAWIGNEIYISGSGSRSATITFKGSYKGSLVTTNSNGEASARVRVSVEDLNTSSDIGGNTVFERTRTGSQLNYQGSINAPLTVTLQAGHRYALRIGVASSCSVSLSTCQASAAFCDGDIWGQWAPAPGGNGITYTGIELRWN